MNVDQRRLEVSGAEIFMSVRNRDSNFFEEAPASRFRSPVLIARIGRVHRHPETYSERAFQRRGIEHSQIRLRRIADAVADALHQTRPLENLFGQRPW